MFASSNLVGFCRSDDVAFVSEADAGVIYQVDKNGKWLDTPTTLVSGPKGPQGMTIGIDGNLLDRKARIHQ